jgi:hypothetical protein
MFNQTLGASARRTFPLLFLVVIAPLALKADIFSNITITGEPSTGPLVQWVTPITPGISNVWRDLGGGSYGAYFDHLLTVNPGDSGTLDLRIAGFGGFAFLDPYGSKTGYQIDVVDGSHTLSLDCVVTGHTCSGTGQSSSNGIKIWNFTMQDLPGTDSVYEFADSTGNAPGFGDSGSNIAVSLQYSVPEPSALLLTALMGAALFGMSGVLRKRM